MSQPLRLMLRTKLVQGITLDVYGRPIFTLRIAITFPKFQCVTSMVRSWASVHVFTYCYLTAFWL